MGNRRKRLRLTIDLYAFLRLDSLMESVTPADAWPSSVQ